MNQRTVISGLAVGLLFCVFLLIAQWQASDQVATDLNAANATITQQRNIQATQAVQIDSALLLAETAYLDATQSAYQVGTAMGVQTALNSTAAQEAVTRAAMAGVAETAYGEAMQGAEALATAAGVQTALNDRVVQGVATNAALADAAQLTATGQTDIIFDLRTTLEAQATTIIDLRGGTPDLTLAGFERRTGRGVAIELPRSYRVVDLDLIDVPALDAYSILGLDEIGGLLNDSELTYLFVGVDRLGTGGYSDVIAVAQGLLPFTTTLPDYVERLEDAVVLGVYEITTVLLDNRPAARVLMRWRYDNQEMRRMIYYVLDGSSVYILMYEAQAAQFDNRFPMFERSARTFEIIGSSG